VSAELNCGQLAITCNDENTKSGLEFPLYVVLSHHFYSLFVSLCLSCCITSICVWRRIAYARGLVYTCKYWLYIQDCEDTTLSQLLRSCIVRRQREYDIQGVSKRVSPLCKLI
jgi:hypothetical protein